MQQETEQRMEQYVNEERIAKAIEAVGYQLTRLADQGEPTRIVFAKKPAPDVAGLVERIQRIVRDIKHRSAGVNGITIDDVERGLNAALSTHKEGTIKPAPDVEGLVETLKLAVSNDTAAKKGWCVNHDCQHGVDNMVGTELGIHIIFNALAAHKPEVDDDNS